MQFVRFLPLLLVILSEASPLTTVNGASPFLPSLRQSHHLIAGQGLERSHGRRLRARASATSQGESGCPRPTDLSLAKLTIGAIVPEDQSSCYYVTDCPEISLFSEDSTPQWRDYASGEGDILQYIEDYFNQNKPLPGLTEGLKDGSHTLVQAAATILNRGTFECNIWAPNSCVAPSGQLDCQTYGAAGYNLLNSFANFYAMATEMMGAINQAAITVEPDAIVSNFTISSQQPPQLNAEQFFQIALGFLGGFGGVIGEWANDAKTIAALTVTHSGTNRDSFLPSHKNEPPKARAAPAPKPKPSDATPATPAKPAASAAASSNPLSALNITSAQSQLKTYASTAINILTGVKDALPSNANSSVPSLNTFLSNMVNTSLSALESFTESIFTSGQYQFSGGQTWNLALQDGQVIPETLMMFEDLMINGSLLAAYSGPMVGPTGLVNQLAKTMTSQMIQYVWHNGDGGSGVVPFVTWDDAPCGQVKSVYLGDAIGALRMQADVTKAQTTIDGRCYYLLGAMAATCTPPKAEKRMVGPPLTEGEPFPCCATKLLTGGTAAVLDGTQFAGLTVDDMIQSAVATWTHNGSKNGGTPPGPADISAAFPAGVASLGSSVIPVCDYRNLAAPGVGCPDLTAKPNCPLVSQK